MGKISVGDVVFVSFPFSDLSYAKLRPALVLAYAQKVKRSEKIFLFPRQFRITIL